RGLDVDLIRTLNHEATDGLMPDLTLLLDIPPEVGLSRGGSQLEVTGREPLEFHERVREGFLSLATEEPGRFVVIDATLPQGEVAEHVLAAVEKLL
ncbi:MAG: dTMP kinase, partial [Vicinamibacterales bacterium]